jgi:hypothetical protein
MRSGPVFAAETSKPSPPSASPNFTDAAAALAGDPAITYVL